MKEINALIFGHKNPDTDSICSSLVQEKMDKNNRMEYQSGSFGKSK